MIILHSYRITDGIKCYKPKPVKNKFIKTEQELDEYINLIRLAYIGRKYPAGFPPSRDMERKPVLCEPTCVTVPDREFLFYLVTELKFKYISSEIVKMLV